MDHEHRIERQEQTQQQTVEEGFMVGHHQQALGVVRHA